MPKKGGIFRLFSGRNQQQPKESPAAIPVKTLSATLMMESIATAELIVKKWDLNSPTNCMTPSLFYDTRQEAQLFLHAVSDLQRAMVFFSSADCLESPKVRTDSLIRAQSLMQMGMSRLEKEFHQILSANRDRLDPESVSHRSPRSSFSDMDSEDDTRNAGESISEVRKASDNAMADLRSIAETMISAGYGKECVKIYNTMRKSIVNEGLYRLGFENLTLSQVQKLDREVLDLKVRSWLRGSGTAVRTLLAGERILCDHVFQGSGPIAESCFAEITKEAATQLLTFPELVAKSKRSPEKLFRLLDLYRSVSDLWIDIESVFSFESTSAVRRQALSTFLNLTEASRVTILDFESAIQKDGSKIAVSGGGIHPLTRYAMDYLVALADYELALEEIFADFPVQTPHPLPESFFDTSSSSSSSYDSAPSPLSIRIAWLILVLLCKLDGKAEIFKEVAQSYLFLMNNLHYVIVKVRASNLKEILGEDWAVKHESKVRHYAASYERLGWARIAAEIPVAVAVEVAAERIGVFYANFEEAVRLQREWVVADERMKKVVVDSVVGLIVPAYRMFYETYRPVFADGDVAVVRYGVEDVKGWLMELFSGSGGSDMGLDSNSSRRSWWARSSSVIKFID